MASTSATPPPSDVLSGARANFMLNGVSVGYAGQCSVAHNYSYSPIQVIGSLEVLGHVPTAYMSSLTFNQLRLVGTNLRTAGWWPFVGNTPTDHLRALVAIPELTAVLEDSVTSTVCALAIGCRIESSSLNVSSSGLWGEDVSVVVRRILLEGDQI